MLNTMLIDLRKLTEQQKVDLRHFAEDNKIDWITRVETEKDITHILDTWE